MRKTEFTFLLIATVLITYFWLDSLENATFLDIQYVHLDNSQKIINIDDSIVTPVLYDSLIINKFISVEERKQQFINQVLPAILIVKYQIENKSKQVDRIIQKIEDGIPLNPKEEVYVDSMMLQYRAKSNENLLQRLKPHPVSLVLAQAAVESGWGSSRFAIEGNNLFGIWANRNDVNSIKSLYNATHVKKYLNVAESIDHYFLTIGRNNAYQRFRSKRYEEANVFQLLETLDRYSVRGDDYTQQLKMIIEWNDLQKYDQYVIDSKYIVKESVWEYHQKQVFAYISNLF